MKNQKKRIVDLENKVRDAKMTYNEALSNLEQISEDIHRMREERRYSNTVEEIVNTLVNIIQLKLIEKKN